MSLDLYRSKVIKTETIDYGSVNDTVQFPMLRRGNRGGGKITLKKVQNEAAQRALTVLLSERKDRPANGVEILRMIKRHTNEKTDTLDLSNCDLTDSNIVILASILESHPSIRFVDLSGTAFTDTGGKLLLRAIEISPKVERISLLDTQVSAEIRERISRAGLLNAQRNQDSIEKAYHKRLLHETKHLMNKIMRDLDQLGSIEKRTRAEYVVEEKSVFVVLKKRQTDDNKVCELAFTFIG